MEKLILILDKIIRALLSILFGLVSLCVLTQIVARYTPPEISAPWTDEMTRLFFMYTMMLGAPWAVLYHHYASIDILTAHLKGKLALASAILADLIVIGVCALGIPQARLFFEIGTFSRSTSLQLNLGLFYVVPLVIFSLTFICCVIDIIRRVQGKGGLRS